MILCNLFSTFFSLVRIPSMHIFLSRYCSSVHFTLIYCDSLFVHPDSNRTVQMATQEDSRKHLPTAIDDLITGFDPKKLKHADLLEKNPLPSKEGWWIIFPHISFNLWVGLWLTFFYHFQPALPLSLWLLRLFMSCFNRSTHLSLRLLMGQDPLTFKSISERFCLNIMSDRTMTIFSS